MCWRRCSRSCGRPRPNCEPLRPNYILAVATSIAALDLTATLALTQALTLGLLSIVGVVASLYPIATVLLARAFLGERLGRIQQLGVLIAFIGISLIAA